MLSHLQFASLCRKNIRIEWSNGMVKASTGRMSPLTVKLSMPTEAEKHVDTEMQYFV
jgi:hypothetical protein